MTPRAPTGRRLHALGLVLLLAAAAASRAQEAPAPVPASGISVPSLTEVAPPEEAFTLRYGNRTVVELRARVVGRTPRERGSQWFAAPAKPEEPG